MGFRINDTVRARNRPVAGAMIIGTIIAIEILADNVSQYTVKDEAGNKHDFLGTEMTMERAADPMVLEGVTVRLSAYDHRACTISRVNPKGTKIDFREDVVTTYVSDESGEDEEYTRYDPNPTGRLYGARRRSDGNWYVENTDFVVDIGVRAAIVASETEETANNVILDGTLTADTVAA